MEPRAGAPQEQRASFGLRLAAGCALLVGTAFVQSPGFLVPDTKFDLALDPARFLSRSLHLWDGSTAFGQLQNQAYGYLWPMGPFFLAGDGTGVPAWAVQRLWLALVMAVAFLGCALVCRALGVRSDLACLVAGVAYATSPRMLTVLGPISIEAWPGALAPWVLLPLVVGSTRGSPRRAAALSALAIAMVGGVNAAATFAVLPLGVLWLLTRTRGPRRRVLMTWWPVFTLLGTLWWLLPLFVLGSYSPPFLDYIESAANTTFSTNLVDALRGTSNWVPYVSQDSRAGNDLIRQPTLILNTGFVLVLGLAGLVLRRNPHRLFLSCGVLLGLALVTMGHLGAVQGWAAPELHRLLDGVLAPLRNVHKFDPVVRLPLTIGLAYGLEALVQAVRDRPRSGVPIERFASQLNPRVLVAAAVIAVLGATLPAATGRIAPQGALAGVPAYWHQAAAWLDDEDAGIALLVPGSAFGDYVWGSPHDEPFQALARDRWGVRNVVPLVPPGNIRMLDAIEARFAEGRGSPGMAAYLRRAGVTHLVVRNDLARSASVPDPVLVHQALEDSPGLVRVATFGVDVGGEAHLEGRDGSRIVINGGWQDSFPAIEIYEVEGDATRALTATDSPVVAGGPEDLLDLADLGLLSEQPTRLAADLGSDQPDPDAPLILTDGLRRAERHFGRVHDGTSQTLGSDDPVRMDRPVRDYLLPGGDRWTSQAVTSGGQVSASSSMSDADANGTVQPGQMPYAAADRDPRTAWTANFDSSQSAWWQLDLEDARRLDGVRIRSGDQSERVRIVTENARSAPVVLASDGSTRIELSDPSTSWLRVEDASGKVAHRMTLAEVRIPGVEVERSIRLPMLPEVWGNPDAVVLRAVGSPRTGCARIDAAVRCVVGRAVDAEEPHGFGRSFSLATAQAYHADLRVRARPGDRLIAALLQDQPIGISASSDGSPDARASALAAIDGDPGTTWTASLGDFRPELRLNWLTPSRISGIDLDVASDTAARLPQIIELAWPGGSRELALDGLGRATFPMVTTDQITLRVGEAEPVTSLDFSSNAVPVPVGVSELRVTGLPYAPVTLPTAPRRIPCGRGPTLMVNGSPVATSVTASPADLYAGRVVDAQICSSPVLGLGAGVNELDMSGTLALTPVSLVLTAGSLAADPPSTASEVDTSADGATYEFTGDGTVLALDDNTNPGWTATQDGRRLVPIVFDGWRLGWALQGPAPVRTEFGPDSTYRLGLLAGGLALLLLIATSALLVRRTGRTGAEMPPLTGATGGRLLTVLLAGAAGGLLGGWPGLFVSIAAVGVAAVLAHRWPDLGAVAVGVALCPAVLAFALRPWGGEAGWAGSLGWPPYFVIVACVLPLGFCLADVRPPRSRSAGRSTSR